MNSQTNPNAAAADYLLQVNNLSASFVHGARSLAALKEVSFTLSRGERLGIVGESGAGKSLAAAALINLLSPPGKIDKGEIWFDGQNLLTLSPPQLRHIRGRHIATIFQDPMTTLNPVLTIGEQLTECLRAHHLDNDKNEYDKAVAALREVFIPAPESRMNAYPHELSGGMRQRVVIAAALICTPQLIIADEPTTALDVTIQADIMALLAHLCRSKNMALILITHDLSLVSQMTDNIAVMYSGQMVEQGATAAIINAPQHPYTRGLLASLLRRHNRRFYQIPGNMPPLSAIPAGCAFHPRCQYRQPICETQSPPPTIHNERTVACHFAAAIADE